MKSKQLLSLVIVILGLVLVAGCLPVATYNIAGKVVDDKGNGLANVTIKIAGDTTGQTKTDATGNFSVTLLKGNNPATLTPELEGWSFTPSQQLVSGPTTTLLFTGKQVVLCHLTANVQGQGNVQVSPAQATYYAGTEIELTAVPAEGWQFDHWEGALTGTTNPDSLTLQQDATVTAVFTEIPKYTLTIQTSEGGTCTVFPVMDAYPAGTEVIVTASPKTGWEFSHWEGAKTGTTNPLVFKVTENMTIKACFSVTGFIQGKINAAQNGDTVIIPQGVYNENIDFKGKNILLKSSNPNDAGVVAATVIKGLGKGSVVTFNSGETGAALMGFTITTGGGVAAGDGSSDTVGGGIYIGKNSTNTVISRNVIKDNGATRGGGIYVHANANILLNTITGNAASDGAGVFVMSADDVTTTVDNNTIKGNIADMHGGAVMVEGSDTGLTNITNNSLQENQAKLGGAVQVNGATAWVYGNSFLKNTALDAGGGVYVWQIAGRITTIKANSFTQNTASNGGAVMAQGNSFANENPVIALNTFTLNTAHAGGAIHITQIGKAKVFNNTFTQNTADAGGAIAVLGQDNLADCAPQIASNYLEQNIANAGGGAIFLSNTQATLTDNLMYANKADLGGGIMVNGKNLVTCKNNTVDANKAINGAGLYAGQEATVKLDYNTFKNNVATNHGGGIWGYQLTNLQDANGTTLTLPDTVNEHVSNSPENVWVGQ